MTLPLIVRPEAEADLAAARDWYERQKEGLGEAFLARVRDAIQRIRMLPESQAVILGSVRRVRVSKFPYAVFYRVDPAQITVLGVFHNRRDPGVWRARIES